MEHDKKKERYTKRDILSEVARVFDPIGLLLRSVVFMKIFFQKLWRRSLHCGELISEEFYNHWSYFQNNLEVISQL